MYQGMEATKHDRFGDLQEVCGGWKMTCEMEKGCGAKPGSSRGLITERVSAKERRHGEGEQSAMAPETAKSPI